MGEKVEVPKDKEKMAEFKVTCSFSEFKVGGNGWGGGILEGLGMLGVSESGNTC